jgi:hypothetical protein
MHVMPTKPPRYRLVIFEVIDQPQALRETICQATGMHPTDAVQWLARAPGTWPQTLEESEVRKLLDGLYEAGVAAEAWRTDAFPELGPARTVHRAACMAEGLRIEGLRGEPTHWVPWDRVEMICAGRIAAEDEYRHVQPPRWPSTVVSGIRALALMKPKVFNRRARAMRIPRDPVGEVIIVRRDPRVAFRVVENQMNYAYLGQRLSHSAAENFPIFVADLCARADWAYITPSTRALLTRQDPAECEFPSSQALLDYATHRLLWSWYRRDRDAQSQTQGLDAEDQDEHEHEDPSQGDSDDDAETGPPDS